MSTKYVDYSYLQTERNPTCSFGSGTLELPK